MTGISKKLGVKFTDREIPPGSPLIYRSLWSRLGSRLGNGFSWAHLMGWIGISYTL